MLKTVLVGLGRIGWSRHLPSIISHDGFWLAAVVDADEGRLTEARVKYNVNCYIDFDDMLNAEKPDLVVIATPTHLHKQHACSAMRSGADVFLDKPMAKNLKEAMEIEAVKRETGRKLMVYQPHRAVAEAVIIKQIIESGIIGKPYMIKRANTGYRRRNDWQSLKKYGGGELFNTGSHFLDQMVHIMGERFSRCSCFCHKIATLGDAEDVVKIVCSTQSGMTVDLDLNAATAYDIEPWMVLGEYGGVIKTKDENGNPVFRVKYYIPEDLELIELSDNLAAKDRLYVNHKPIEWKYRDYSIKQDMSIDFYDKCYEYFAQDKKPFVPIEDTLYVMEVLQKLSEHISYNSFINKKN